MEHKVVQDVVHIKLPPPSQGVAPHFESLVMFIIARPQEPQQGVVIYEPTQDEQDRKGDQGRGR